MSDARGQARRYHWLSSRVRDFVQAPHAAIEGEPRGEILNLTDERAARARSAQIELLADGPDRIVEELRLHMPHEHRVRASDVNMRRLRGSIAAAADRGPRDFAQLLLTPGVGARTVASLALVAEVVHGAPSRFSDPARFAYAHGGKDGHPFPVPVDVYDHTLGVLRRAVDSAHLGNDERLSALRRLDREARRLEQVVEGGEDFAALVARERAASASYGGRTVFGRADPASKRPNPGRRSRSSTADSGDRGPSRKANSNQLSLF